jgi:hypothetical protein
VGSGTPRFPRKFVPQHATSPLLHSAQLCDQPVDTLATPSRHAASRPAIGTGGEIRGDPALIDGLGGGLDPQPATTTAPEAPDTTDVINKSLNGSIEAR